MLRLRQLRLEKKLRQVELCHLIKISQSTLSSWETGRYEIDNDNLKKLCEFFDVTSDYLLGLSSNRHGYHIPDDLQDIRFAFNGFDFTGLTQQNIDDLRIVAEMMRKKNKDTTSSEE